MLLQNVLADENVNTMIGGEGVGIRDERGYP